MGEYFTSGLFCLQRKHLAHEYFITFCFSRGGVVSASPNPQAVGPPLVGCPRLLIQFIRSYPPYRRPFVHPQPEDAPWRGDRDPQTRDIYRQIFIKVPSMKCHGNPCSRTGADTCGETDGRDGANRRVSLIIGKFQCALYMLSDRSVYACTDRIITALPPESSMKGHVHQISL